MYLFFKCIYLFFTDKMKINEKLKKSSNQILVGQQLMCQLCCWAFVFFLKTKQKTSSPLFVQTKHDAEVFLTWLTWIKCSMYHCQMDAVHSNIFQTSPGCSVTFLTLLQALFCLCVKADLTALANSNCDFRLIPHFC